MIFVKKIILKKMILKKIVLKPDYLGEDPDSLDEGPDYLEDRRDPMERDQRPGKPGFSHAESQSDFRTDGISVAIFNPKKWSRRRNRTAFGSLIVFGLSELSGLPPTKLRILHSGRIFSQKVRHPWHILKL
jgi:hypothetical protein